MAKSRRLFLKEVVAGGVASQAASAPADGRKRKGARGAAAPATPAGIDFPRTLTGRQLAQVSFPLGGICAGSIGLGGRGQLRDWQIFNRPEKGASPAYAFASIHARSGRAAPVTRVVESRILPPFEGSSGLGSDNVPGLPRLESATFRGSYPLALIDFQDRELPVHVSLDAFTPFIPLEADDSGLPVAVLRYKVKNPAKEAAKVGLALSLANPVGREGRTADYRTGEGLAGLLMHNPFLAASDPLRGSFALAAIETEGAKVSYLRGWALEGWWTPALLFWDDFSADGELGPEPSPRGTTASLAITREVPAGAEASFTFLLAWHFPNRTPERCGWEAVKGQEKTVIGNHYCTRFADAWAAAEDIAKRLPDLEWRTRAFIETLRQSSLPPAVLDAATANLSTLATPTCFREADGRFHAFEGTNDRSGCCHGTCNHVWNYEVATAFVFPSLSRSMRDSAFGFRTDERGLMDMRELLPFGKQHSPHAAADGQMGQVMKLYLDWRQSGDVDWLKRLWPGAKRALEFAWIKGGWDPNRDGVMEGSQHNTYDVEFYGPNPLCGVWYLGALRAGEEMARAVGDEASAREYRKLFESGKQWIDANLFNGEYYVQKVQGIPRDQIAEGLVVGMGAANSENPTLQLGDGCLVDQLLGQWMADLAGLGPLLDPSHTETTAKSLWKYNYKPSLARHESVMRTYALNDEAGMIVCDYGGGRRPQVPFPYYAECWTGLEYAAAALLIVHGLAEQGVRAVESVRRRYDGERRNPWDEPECGHNYARAMSSWSLIPALSGFSYDAPSRRISIRPAGGATTMRAPWFAGSAWGAFELRENSLHLTVLSGRLECAALQLGDAKPQTVQPAINLSDGDTLRVSGQGIEVLTR